MRLFVALLPPPEALDDVDSVVTPYRAAWPDLRWTRRELWHVTVAFLGEMDDRAIDRLLPRLDRVAARYPALDLSFAGAGAFSRPASARVLWTGITGDRDRLARLSASAEAAGRRAGAPGGRSGGQPRPHLTLARCRQPSDLRTLVQSLSPYEGPAWHARELHLMRSQLGPRPEYGSLRQWPLTGRGQAGKNEMP